MKQEVGITEKLLKKAVYGMLVWTIAVSANAFNYEVKTDLLGRKHIYSGGHLIATMKQSDSSREIFYDDEREIIGSSVTREDGGKDYFDGHGNIIGHAYRDDKGGFVYYDGQGNCIGNSRDNGINDGVMFFDVVISGANTPESHNDDRVVSSDHSFYVKSFFL